MLNIALKYGLSMLYLAFENYFVTSYKQSPPPLGEKLQRSPKTMNISNSDHPGAIFL